MDIGLPKINGIEATRVFTLCSPASGFSAFPCSKTMKSSSAFHSGASAYLSKSGDTDVLISTIRGKAGFQ